MSKETIALASDHGGYTLKNILKETIVEMGFDVLDLGCDGSESVDYPDFANAMAEAIGQNKAERGILVCGSGIGISMAANRHKHIRAALVHDGLTSRLCREHNNANVMVVGERVIGVDVAKDCLKHFLDTEFEGGRHAGRVGKMS